jgi:hypothetical protein
VSVGLAALAIAVSGMFGGLDETRPPSQPIVATKQPNPGQPWSITINRALSFSTMEPLLKPDKEGYRWIIVRATMEITADRTWNRLDGVLRLKGVEGLRDVKPSDFYLVRDESFIVRELQPGIPEEVAFLWQQDGRAPRPEYVDVEILGLTQRRSSLTDHLEWLDSAPRALVLRVPVKDEG